MLHNSNEKVLNQLEIGERIFQLRTEKKMSQARLADEVGVSNNSISNIELGKQMCTIETMHHFAHAFDTSIEFLLYGSSTDNGKVLEKSSEEDLLLSEIIAELEKMSLLDQKRLLAGLKAANSIVVA